MSWADRDGPNATPSWRRKRVKKKPIHALIDADILLYQTSSAVEKAIDWGGDLWTLHSDANEAKQMFDVALGDILENVMTKNFTLCFSSPNNFRIRILADYKANRVATRKPLAYAAVKKYAEETYKTASYPTLEADDVIGILATCPKPKHSYVMVSEDKDFKTIPGMHYNPRTGVWTSIDEEQADYHHLFQTLVGDTTDNYKGCPGVGPVKAGTLLTLHQSWDTVVAAFETAGLTEEDALTQARVARILRHGEYDIKTAEVKLWKPPTPTSHQSRTPASEKSSTPEASETPVKAKVVST
jgi:DNA polymerase-1